MNFKVSILKTVLAILNTCLAFLGIGLVALSVFDLNTSTPGTIQHITNVVQIFIGSFVVLTSFLGCFGTCRASLSLFWSYGICVVILVLFQLYIIIVAHSTHYVENAGQEFERLWRNQTNNLATLANLQQARMCCGEYGARDYSALGNVIPESCYENAMKSSQHLFKRGCLEAVQRHAAKNGEIGLTIKWILFFTEIMSITSTALLSISVHNKRRRELF